MRVRMQDKDQSRDQDKGFVARTDASVTVINK
jgi:hypothetical protein